MKDIQVKKRDAFDLYLVTSSILRENSEKMEFKDVIKLQRVTDIIKESAVNFHTEYDKVQELKEKLLKAAQTRIDSYKKVKIEETRESSDAAGYKAKIDAFAAVEVDSMNLQINEEITPALTTIYEGIGEEETSFKLEDDQHRVLLDSFEKHAKEKYTSKSRMTIVYDALTKGEQTV